MSASDSVHLQRLTNVSGTVPALPSSKSVSNRALIIDGLTGFQCRLTNLSSARDTALMQQLIRSKDHVIDVKDAGTTMRFLTAFFSVTRQSKLLTGTARMKERPLRLLVAALRQLGVTIRYTEKDGFPPIEIIGFDRQVSREISIRGDVSSQYISALMMVAPVLEQGLTIHLEGAVGSRPYIDMTAALMQHFGVVPVQQGPYLRIEPGIYKPTSYRIEADWSAASYWFSMAALADQANILLPGVGKEALQGDRIIIDIMRQLGVDSSFEPMGLRLKGGKSRVAHLEWDFKDCPDLAQTILPACAALGVSGQFTGLESLRIKETDRIAALQRELAKFGAAFDDHHDRWTLTPGKMPYGPTVIHTYHDHRMAMGFAPLATRGDLIIEDPTVVDKSYPDFWNDLKAVGFTLTTPAS